MDRSTLTPRQQEILGQVRARGFLTVEALAERFAVTPQTIRKEVNTLAARALVQRVHGGVAQPSNLENADWGVRRVLNLEEKQRIARLVVEHIPERASLFLNIGTTTEEVARALSTRRGLRVVTNNLHVAGILAGNEEIEVIVAGGLVRARDQGVIGELTVDFIRQFRVDFGIIGISGIDADGSLLDFDYREVLVSRAIIASSRRVFLVSDVSKFGRSAMVRLGHISQVSDLFLDRAVPEDYRTMLAAAEGLAVHIAPPE